METNFYSISGQNISQNFQGAVLKDGGTASVRILKDLGGGKFLANVSGNLINVTASNVSEGEVFSAVLSVKNGNIILSREKSWQNIQQNNSVLNLMENEVTQKLIQFFQQSGGRIKKEIILKAKRLAKEFPEKEKQAAEAAAILEEKGISADKENVSKMIKILEKYENQEKNEQTDDSILALVNHSKNKDENSMHWILLPYEWEDMKISGLIRILVNIETNSTEKINISANSPFKKYFFVVYFKKSKVQEVRFCTLPSLLPSQIHIEEKSLGELFGSGMSQKNSVPVTYSTLALTDGFCACEEEILSLDKNL